MPTLFNIAPGCLNGNPGCFFSHFSAAAEFAFGVAFYGFSFEVFALVVEFLALGQGQLDYYLFAGG